MPYFMCLFLVIFLFSCQREKLYQSTEFTIKHDRVEQDTFRAVARSATHLVSNYMPQSPPESDVEKKDHGQGVKEWKLSEDISRFPAHRSGQLLVDALYNLSLEEVLLNLRGDGAFMAGEEWTGVWTRDISYSILLSLAFLHPEAAKTSLRLKVQNDRIIQDTGTGGSWPVSTDRMTWAPAAWEVYKVTGDREWLQYAFRIIRNSAEDDLLTAYDAQTGLFNGESSFLDWREQSYPRWMDPKDIYASQCLGTNAVHYRTYRILEQMGNLLEQDVTKYAEIAVRIREGINGHLWMEEKEYYGQYLYGRASYAVSPRSESLGEALTVLFGVSDEKKTQRLIRSMPVLAFGPPCIFPQIPGIPPYHNNGIWPFVVAFQTWAAAEAGNMAAVEHGLASIYRAAALFLTNKENMVAGSGDYKGAEINSDRQLWSVAGNLATVYRVLLGLRFETDGIRFRPFVPGAYDGTRLLEGLSYRSATLNISVEGHGSRIADFRIDGREQEEAFFPAEKSGEHYIYIRLSGNDNENSGIHLVANRFSPATPQVREDNGILSWDAVEGAVTYRHYRNGGFESENNRTEWQPAPASLLESFQVAAVDSRGTESFLSEPVLFSAPENRISEQAERSVKGYESNYSGFHGRGFVELSRERNTALTIPLEIEKEGRYLIRFRYANGEGPLNTDNKCAIRSLYVDGERLGAVVFPQRGEGNWEDWGMSSSLETELAAGSHQVQLRFEPSDRNMNGETNRALVDEIVAVRIEN